MIKTKIATIMNNIGQLHAQLSEQHIALSGIMGEGVELASAPKLGTDVPATETQPAPVIQPAPIAPVAAVEPTVINAPQQTIAAPVAPVPTVLNASSTSGEVPNAPIAPIAPNTPTVAPIAPVAPLTESSTATAPNASVELDSEGYYWDERIHACTKKKVKSKLVKPDGEMWRIKQKCDPALVEQVRAEQKAAGFGIIGGVTTPVAAPVAPIAPVNGLQTPIAPVAPVAPIAPVTPTVDYQAIKTAGIETMNKMVNDYGVEYDDVLEALRKKFTINDYEDLVDAQFQAVADFLSGLLNQYDAVHQLVLQMRQWGGDANAAGIDTNMLAIYGVAHSETLGGIHYSDLPAITTAVTAYHATWVAAGFGA